jgi:hypothetical protein
MWFSEGPLHRQDRCTLARDASARRPFLERDLPRRCPRAGRSTAAREAGRLLGRVAHRLDVIAVGVADEGAIVIGVIFGPNTRLVEHLGALTDGGVEEGAHRGAIGGLKGDVDLSIRLARGERADPERGFAIAPVADHPAEVHHTPVIERCQHGVIKGGRARQVSALDGQVVEHAGERTRRRSYNRGRAL